MNVTVAVPADHEALVEAFVQEPLNVQGPLPKAMYAVDAETFTLPVTLPFDAPDIVMFALPERVRLPLTVKPFVAVTPIVIDPPECVTPPDTVKSKVPMAIVPIELEAVVVREAIAAFTLTVAVPEPLLLSKWTSIEAVGTGQPNGPPDEDAQWLVSFQFPEPRTQNAFVPHGAETVTTKPLLPPRVVKMTCPEPLTVPKAN